MQVVWLCVAPYDGLSRPSSDTPDGPERPSYGRQNPHKRQIAQETKRSVMIYNSRENSDVGWILRPRFLLSGYRLVASVILVVALNSTQTFGDEIESFSEPYQDIDVAASEAGSIAEIDVREGTLVKAGQIVARLDERVLRASLEIAKAGKKSRGKLDSALAELHLQTETLSKLEELLSRKHASQREVDRTRAQKEIAEARVKSVREDLLVKTLEYERIRAQIQRRRSYAPIDGIVTRIYKDRGEFVSPGDPVIMKIVQLDPLLIVFSVPVELASPLKVDQSVSLQIGPERTAAEGIVEFVSPTADAQSGTTRVRIRLPNPTKQLPSGAPCRLILSTPDETQISQISTSGS